MQNLMRTSVLALIISASLACGSVPCRVPKFPSAPLLAPEPPECPQELTCLGADDARALGLWLRDVSRWRLSVEACRG